MLIDLKKILFYLLSILSGNRFAQELLGWNVKISKLLMGIGTGVYPKSSGEHILGKLLFRFSKDKKNPLIIFDVGANEGQFSKILKSELENIEYFIHAFEPNSMAFYKLKENFGDNNHFILNNFGLGNEICNVKLHYDKPNSLRASVYHQNLDHLGISFDYHEIIHLDTLDHYCLQNNIAYIDLLKLDVEGYEINILEGSKKALHQGKIKKISFEFGECFISSRNYFKDIYSFLQSYEMKALFRITPTGYLYPVEEYNEKYEQFSTTNFLAIMN